jgi:hypothetical protein
VAKRLGVAFLEIGYPGHGQVDGGLPGPVAEPAVQLEAVRQVSTCQVVPAKLRVGPGKDAVAADLASARRRIQRAARDGGELMPVPAGVQIVRDDRGELPGVAVESGLGSQGGGGEQDVMFGLEPGQGLPLAGQPLARDTRVRGAIRSDVRDGLTSTAAACTVCR